MEKLRFTAAEAACSTCVGACCRARAVTISLYGHEAENLEAAGTKLKTFLPAGDGNNWKSRRFFRKHAEIDNTRERKFVKSRLGQIKPKQGLYGMETDCGFLEKTPSGHSICGAHGTELQPQACKEFRADSQKCHDIRSAVIGRMIEEDLEDEFPTAEFELDLVEAALGNAALAHVAVREEVYQ